MYAVLCICQHVCVAVKLLRNKWLYYSHIIHELMTDEVRTEDAETDQRHLLYLVLSLDQVHTIKHSQTGTKCHIFIILFTKKRVDCVNVYRLGAHISERTILYA